MTNYIKKESLAWDKQNGLIPAIVQDALSLRVLMLGYMTKEALEKTLETNRVTFFSRSKNRLWEKGEESGNTLALVDIRQDCDNDTILVSVLPKGPTCHTGARTCFGEDDNASLSTLADLAATIRDRRENPTPESYTTKLFAAGIPRIAQKVGEEGVEVALAAATQSPTLAAEAADLLYHLLVLLEATKTPLEAVLEILQSRAQEKMSSPLSAFPPRPFSPTGGEG